MQVAEANDEVRQALHDQNVVEYDTPDGLPNAVASPEGAIGSYISCPVGVADYFRKQP